MKLLVMFKLRNVTIEDIKDIILINEDAILETLIGFKRAGANAIITYYADRIQKILK